MAARCILGRPSFLLWQHLLHAKRPATTIPLPEVESPPACVKKIKHNDGPTQIKNTEFKTAVVEKYLLREGMNIIVVLIDIVQNHREYVNIYQYRGCLGCFTVPASVKIILS